MAAGDVSIHGDSGRSIRGIRIVTGTVQLDGGNPTPINLSAYGVQCLGGVVSIRNASAPGDDPVVVTCNPSSATLNVYAWKTDGTDPTLVASTDNAVVVDFVATMRA